MSAHFKWYPASEEVVVPWNARYSFPSQANKCTKITPRIPPKNGAVFLPGQVIRVEFPAQGYVNPINTTFEFDVTLTGWAGGSANLSTIHEITRFQNNIQSIFNRVRLLYGATPLEDVINYNMIVRSLTEWTSTNQSGTMDQVSISEGIGGWTTGQDNNTSNSVYGMVNVRQNYIQGVSGVYVQGGAGNIVPANFSAGSGATAVPNSYIPAGATENTNSYTSTRRYQVNLALGLLTQDKLLPVKFMASQLAIEFTLEQPQACILSDTYQSQATAGPTYSVTNFNIIPEILEFDSSYDAMFLKGLQDGGVPIKFSSWHTFIFSASNSSNVNLLVQERSRSVKALFAMMRRGVPTYATDSHATFFDASTSSATSTMQNYQWRIGGRYFPSQPVQLCSALGNSPTNGGAEAFIELQKALNVVGDYRLSTSVNTLRWAMCPSSTSQLLGSGFTTSYNELDYKTNCVSFTTGNPGIPNTSSDGRPEMKICEIAGNGVLGVPTNAFASSVGSGCYTSAIDLETSNGIEISGLNAEEQSDIAFIANWATPQNGGSSSLTFNPEIDIYSYYDAMLVLRENNILELIQ